MTQQPTKEQVLDALQTHKTVQKAARALGLSYPKMQHWLKKYGIVCNHNAKQVDEMTNLEKEAYADGRRTPSRFRWLRNIFKKGE